MVVSRLKCKGETQNVDLRLDVATDVYPMKQGDRFIFTIVSTLRKDGKPDDGTYDQSDEVGGMLVLPHLPGLMSLPAFFA